MINRRVFVGGALALTMAPAVAMAEDDEWRKRISLVDFDELDIEPSTPATPTADLPVYDGDDSALRYAPWKLDGKVFEVGCALIERIDAPKGKTLLIGGTDLWFPTIMFCSASAGDIFIGVPDGVDSDLGTRKAFRVKGTYGGLFRFGIADELPIVIASEFIL